MALATQKMFLQSSLPLIRATRFRSKINIQKPKQPHYEKSKYLAITQPIFINPKKGIPPVELCQKSVNIWEKSTENPFQDILARELYKRIESSRLVAFFHANPIASDDQFKAFAMFKKENMLMKSYGKETLRKAVEGTPYGTILEFYVLRNTMVFSREPEIKKLLKVIKKFPQLVLLAGIYEGELLNLDQLMAISVIPNIETAQAELVQTLNRLGSTVVQQLNSHQSSLVGNLEQRMNQLEES